MVGHTAGALETFTVPAPSGNYASEVLYLRRTVLDNQWQFSQILEVVVNVASLPASATLEIDLLKPGLDPTDENSWFKPAFAFTSTGLQSPVTIYAAGVRARAKSGGSSGDAEIAIYYLY